MSVKEQIQALLKKHNVAYQEFHHKPVRTSEEAASLRNGYTLSQGAKAIIITAKYSKNDRRYVMLVLPGDKRINGKKVRKVIGAKSFSFATEEEVLKVTGGVLPGGVPPFGNIFDIPVYVDESLGENQRIVFNAGDRSYSIGMNYSDFVNIVNPILTSFS